MLFRSEEWRTAWQPAWFEYLGSHWQPIMTMLNYEPLPAHNGARLSLDIGAALDWRGLTDPVRNRIWRELIMSDQE